MTTIRDSHAWCAVCKAPPAAPCYAFCAIRLRKIAACAQRIAQDQSRVARQAADTSSDVIWGSAPRLQEQASQWYLSARKAAGVE